MLYLDSKLSFRDLKPIAVKEIKLRSLSAVIHSRGLTAVPAFAIKLLIKHTSILISTARERSSILGLKLICCGCLQQLMVYLLSRYINQGTNSPISKGGLQY